MSATTRALFESSDSGMPLEGVVIVNEEPSPLHQGPPNSMNSEATGLQRLAGNVSARCDRRRREQELAVESPKDTAAPSSPARAKRHTDCGRRLVRKGLRVGAFLALTLSMRLPPVLLALAVTTASYPHAAGSQETSSAASATSVGPSEVGVSSDFRIGPNDVLAVRFWGEEAMNDTVTVRPDGMITLPLIGGIQAAGLTPEALAAQIRTVADEYLTGASVTVAVEEVNSREVFITGQVERPDAYPLTGPRTVIQLIALAGGLLEWADSGSIRILRPAGGETHVLEFNYGEVARGRRLEQNVELRPGDTVVVP